MRSLMFSLSFLLLFASARAQAEAPSARLRSGVKTERGTTGLVAENSSAAATFRNSLDLNSGSYVPNVQAQVGYDQTNADYSRYLLTDRSGTQTPLSSIFHSAEKSLRLGTTLFLPRTTITMNSSHTVGPTPFPGYTAQLGGAYDFLAHGAKVSLTYARADHRLPKSFFVDPISLSPKLRNNRNLENRLGISWEQILSDRMKAKIDFFGSEKKGSRPLNRGAELSIGQAITESSALFGKGGLSREKESDPLFDERGFLSATWAQLEYRLEPSYRWSLSAKLGTVLETESARGRLPRQRVGTDSLGLSGLTRFRFGEVGIRLLGSRSNTGYRTYSIGGDLSWNL